MNWMRRGVLALGLVGMLSSCATLLKTTDKVPWFAVSLPFDPKAPPDLLDIEFTDANTGWLVGSKTAVYKTTDAGKTWQNAFTTPLLGEKDEKGQQTDLRARFTSVDFTEDGQEGWIVGKPRIVLHTTDAGKTWFAIPLNKRINGNPLLITALANGEAELAMDSGFVFKTRDGGKVWRAMTPVSAGGLIKSNRAEDGSYWGVTTRGASYVNWKPGAPDWTINEHKSTPKRIQNAVRLDKQYALLLNNGGEIELSKDSGQTWAKPTTPDFASAAAMLDATLDGKGQIWMGGGNGNLLVSADQGQTWERVLLDTTRTIFQIEFVNPDLGFILGQKGLLMRYQTQTP